jgi:excinuclease UvrABC nuclease subunit
MAEKASSRQHAENYSGSVCMIFRLSDSRNTRRFITGPALPLQLPIDSGALRLLQRIVTKHTFANAYHQLLEKADRRSVLDDCRCKSEPEESALTEICSVNRLRKATVDEIAATEGIGRKWLLGIASCSGIELPQISRQRIS